MKWSLALALLILGVEEVEVEPREIAWADLADVGFEQKRRLPARRTTEGDDLLRDMERLVAARFELRDPSTGKTLLCFGDVARLARSKPASARGRWLEALDLGGQEGLEGLSESWSQLLLDDRLTSSRWSPKGKHDRDGIHEVEAWPLHQEPIAPWKGARRDPVAEQAAVLIHAGLAEIKLAENDYGAYPSDVGASYEAIYPIDRGHVRGTDPNGNPFAGVLLYFRCDLPLWYGDYSCKLQSLTTVDAKGRVICEIETSSKDFHWLAGRDVFLPVDDAKGRRQGFLLVRQYGFDLDEVPDNGSHRRRALRGSLGNLKRRAEDLMKKKGTAIPEEITVPSFDVKGRR